MRCGSRVRVMSCRRRRTRCWTRRRTARWRRSRSSRRGRGGRCSRRRGEASSADWLTESLTESTSSSYRSSMVDLAPAVAAVRSFNRAYTKVIGLLDEGLVKSPYTLTEVRVLFEIAHAGAEGASVARIREDLGLDAGYLSRIL